MVPASIKRRLRGLADAEVGKAKVILRGGARRLTFLGLAAILAIVAVIILSFAVFFELSRDHGPLMAGFAVSGGLVVAAGLMVLIARLASNRRARIAAEAEVRAARAELISEAEKALLLASAAVPSRGTDRTAVVAALIAGLILGLRK